MPRGALLGAAALVGVALLAALGARVGGLGTTRVPPATAIEIRELRFEDRADGAVLVYRAGAAQPVEVIAPGTNGFVRGVMRGFARERKRQAVGSEPPFRLTRWSDGRLSLDDPATGRHVDLEAFGPVNSGAFARMLLAAGAGSR
jgi:putative photosynthetic complex assembly protein